MSDVQPDRFLTREQGDRALREARRRWKATGQNQRQLAGGAATQNYVELVITGLVVRDAR